MDSKPLITSSSYAAPLTPQHGPDWCASETNNVTSSSDSSDRPRDGNRVHLEQELALLPHMPALFGTDLPPCGLIPQVAYENVVRRLRKMWLQRANTNPVNIRVLGICQWILADYKIEKDKSPAGSQRRTRRRKPWRLEEVFKYELAWARYLVREAEAMERRGGMTEMEREKLYPVPEELHIYLEKTPNEEVMLEMWKVWQRKKRGLRRRVLRRCVRTMRRGWGMLREQASLLRRRDRNHLP